MRWTRVELVLNSPRGSEDTQELKIAIFVVLFYLTVWSSLGVLTNHLWKVKSVRC